MWKGSTAGAANPIANPKVMQLPYDHKHHLWDGQLARESWPVGAELPFPAIFRRRAFVLIDLPSPPFDPTQDIETWKPL